MPVAYVVDWPSGVPSWSRPEQKPTRKGAGIVVQGLAKPDCEFGGTIVIEHTEESNGGIGGGFPACASGLHAGRGRGRSVPHCSACDESPRLQYSSALEWIVQCIHIRTFINARLAIIMP